MSKDIYMPRYIYNIRSNFLQKIKAQNANRQWKFEAEQWHLWCSIIYGNNCGYLCLYRTTFR